jgi:hypothetical protein
MPLARLAAPFDHPDYGFGLRGSTGVTCAACHLSINLGGAGDQVYLVLYGHRARRFADRRGERRQRAGRFLRRAGRLPVGGSDQLGPLPASLAGAGVVNLVITVDGQAANAVSVSFQ